MAEGPKRTDVPIGRERGDNTQRSCSPSNKAGELEVSGEEAQGGGRYVSVRIGVAVVGSCVRFPLGIRTRVDSHGGYS